MNAAFLILQASNFGGMYGMPAPPALLQLPYAGVTAPPLPGGHYAAFGGHPAATHDNAAASWAGPVFAQQQQQQPSDAGSHYTEYRQPPAHATAAAVPDLDRTSSGARASTSSQDDAPQVAGT